MKKLSLLALVALIAATTLFMNNTVTKAQDSNKLIQGDCYKEGFPGEKLAGLKVTITATGYSNYTYSNTNGHYVLGGLENEITYTIVAESPDFNANGGWRGTVVVTTPDCGTGGCAFNLTRNIECTYYNNPN
ncbi:MAG: hypothetical protein AAB071_07340 [Bacteroidota bacterium]